MTGRQRVTAPVKRRNRTALVLVICLAILVISSLSQTSGIGYDGKQYLTYATNLLKTGQFTYDGVRPSCGRAPGYPTFLAAILWVFGGLVMVYPLQLAFLLASYWCVYLCFAPYFRGWWSPLLLLALSAVWPLHKLAMYLMSEPLFIAFTAVALFLLVRSCERRSILLLIAAGIVFGLSAYIRPINILAAVILAGYFLARRHLNWTRAIVLAAAGLIVLAPWTIRNAVKFQRLIPVAAHIGSFYYMTDADAFWPVLLHSAGYSHKLPVHHEIVGDDLELDLEANERYWQRGVANMREDPFGFILRCSVKTVFVWCYLPGSKGMYFDKPLLFVLGIFVQCGFLIVAWIGSRRLRRKSPLLSDAIIGYAIYAIVALWPFYAESRFLLPAYIWLFGLAWYTIQEYSDTIVRVLRKPWKRFSTPA